MQLARSPLIKLHSVIGVVFGTPVTVLRPFNTYGPRQSARAVIPTIISQLAAGQRQINLGALSPTRDFNFVLIHVLLFRQLLHVMQHLGKYSTHLVTLKYPLVIQRSLQM